MQVTTLVEAGLCAVAGPDCLKADAETETKWDLRLEWTSLRPGKAVV